MIGKSGNKRTRVYSSSVTNRELMVEPAPHVKGYLTKDLLMKYTFVALCILAATAVLAFGTAALLIEIIAVVVAVTSDYLLSLVLKERGPPNMYSAAVSGLVVALSFSSGMPYTFEGQQYVPTMNPKIQYVAVAVISAITVILFKKIQGILGRKYVNPAAAAKLMVLAPIWSTALIPMDHAFDVASGSTLQFALTTCFSSNAPFKDPLLTLTILKNHGWLGGASSIAVIVVGIVLLLVCRGYIKWRVPLTFLATIAIISAGYGFVQGEDILLRLAFHLFVGSVIFLAFFMATDPATAPLTGLGQILFAISLGALTFIFQIWGHFLGGSILALVIMNLTVPLLDRVGIHRPFGRR